MSGWSEGITECWGVDANRYVRKVIAVKFCFILGLYTFMCFGPCIIQIWMST